MQSVYKYELDKAITTVDLPLAAKVVHVGIDHNSKVCIWVYQNIDDDEITEERIFSIAGTGQVLHGNKYSRQHVGTVKEDDVFIWHVFEELERN